MKRLKNRKNEKGQAFAELLICLIPLLLIFIAVTFIAVIGVEKIKLFLEARSNVEKDSALGMIGSAGGLPVQYWEIGDDLIPFTADDQAVNVTTESAETFSTQLNTANFAVLSLPKEMTHNLGLKMGAPLFYTAANLAICEEETHDPVKKYGIDDLSNSYDSLFKSKSDFRISEKVFMPITYQDDI